VDDFFLSDGLRLACHVAVPSEARGPLPAVVLCHGYPSGGIDARHSGGTFPELVDEIAAEMKWVGMAFTFRGCATSEGDFSMQGWVDDLRAAISHVVSVVSPTGIWLVGNNTGGSLALCVAADDPRVEGCALLGARADFDDWAAQPRRFLEHSREIGTVKRPGFPPSVEEWGRELRRFRPADAARRYAPRPLLLMHGADDHIVPPADSRVLAQAHGSAELQVIPGAGHRLRHDPRAMAMLFGWLDRQRP
jgi:putative redox protein